MNCFGHFEQAAVTTIAVQFPYAISYGEFSWQSKSVRAVAKPFSRITKSQIRPIARYPNAKKSDDKTGIERSKKVTQTTGTTKAGFSKHGLKAIQITGVSIVNQIPALVEKPSQAQENCTNYAATRQDGRLGFAQKHPRWHLPNQASLYKEQPGQWRQLGRRNHPSVHRLPLSRRRLSRQDVMAIWQHQTLMQLDSPRRISMPAIFARPVDSAINMRSSTWRSGLATRRSSSGRYTMLVQIHRPLPRLPSDLGAWLMQNTGLPWLPRVGTRMPCSA